MRVVIDIYVVRFTILKKNTYFSSPPLQAKAEEELQETQGQIDSLLNELSSLSQPGGRGVGSVVAKDFADAPFSQPEGAVISHTEMLQVRISHLYGAHILSH